jgi:hypothetical protein
MMVLSAESAGASLPEFLAHRARSASLWRLATDAAGGVLLLAATIWWKPEVWLVLASVALFFVGYGTWGMLDRFRSRPAVASHELRAGAIDAFCALAAGLAAIAAMAILFSALGVLLGTWFT